VSVSIFIAACVIVMAVVGLGFYALHKIKPGWLRVETSVLRLVRITMEMGQPSITGKPYAERRELEAEDDGS